MHVKRMTQNTMRLHVYLRCNSTSVKNNTGLQQKIILNRTGASCRFFDAENNAASQISPARQIFKIIKVKYVKHGFFAIFDIFLFERLILS